MNTFKFTFLSLLITFAFSFAAVAQDSGPSVIGVKMDAEWCGKCQAMNPKLEVVKPEFKDEDILFVYFDMTNEFTTQQAAFLANKLNLSGLFNEHKGKTGYMVLLDANTGEVLHTLQSDQSESDLIRDIRSTLASVNTK